MKKKSILKEKKPTFDLLWKKLIQTFFIEFLSVFKPDLLHDIIPDQYEFLDKELVSITAQQHKKIADILVKVYMKNGSCEYILFHIEIQSGKHILFNERMLTYYIRIWEKFKQNITSLALMIDKYKGHHSLGELLLDSYGTRLHFQYPVIYMNDLNFQNYFNSSNPVEVALSCLIDVEGMNRPMRKVMVMEQLGKMGLTMDHVSLLIAFVDRLIALSRIEQKEFEEYVIEKKKDKEMSMLWSSFEEKGYLRGINEGEKKGKKEGKREGKREEEKKIIHNLVKYGMAPEQIARATQIPENKVRKMISSKSKQK